MSDWVASDWVDALVALRAAGTPHVLVTIVEAKGSAPREAGVKMVLTADAQHGSIGGGTLEHKVTGLARRLLADGATAPSTESFPLGPALGQCCGGHVSVLLEPFQAGRFHVALFGAGHVGKALVAVLAPLPCQVTWIDARAEQFPEAAPANVRIEVSDAPVYDVAEAPSGASFLVMTHSHALDRDLIEAILRRGDFAYCGLIGSATKRRRFEARLRAKGVSDAALARLVCPIGVPGVGGKSPGEIAVAVAAQLLQVRGRPAGGSTNRAGSAAASRAEAARHRPS